MTKRMIIAALATLPLYAPTATWAAPSPTVPRQLDEGQAAGYRTVFAAIHAARWDDARLALAAMPPGPLHVVARAELLTAKNSPRAEAVELVDVLNAGPELPQAEQIARIARSRGASELPPLPYARPLTWAAGAPTRARVKAISTDSAALELALRMQPLVKEDRGEDAQALLEQVAPTLSPEALAEWQQKVAFIYYVSGNDAAARPLAQRAAEGVGDWALQARWTLGLIAWRQRDYTTAGQAFEMVATRSGDTELRSAGLFWAARADLAAGRPERIEARLKNAAQLDETFYGLLARQALAIRDARGSVDAPGGDAWRQLAQRPNVRVAAALAEIDEDVLADAVVRQQAKIGDPTEFGALTKLAGEIGLPGTQLWMSNNVPRGVQPSLAARYPSPAWVPDGGWRVDKALVFAHTLQESRFRPTVVSAAGAYGLMQIMPASATDFTRATGVQLDRSMLTRPSVNIAVGQDKLLRLRDMGATGGLLPKVIAAYNAGPRPVVTWNAESRDGGDPLLYIESIPYWETRGYVATVLRNYWMYERQAGRDSGSRAALAQGMWPKFPGMTGAPAVRLQTAVAPPRLNPLRQVAPQLTVDPGVMTAASSAIIIGSR